MNQSYQPPPQVVEDMSFEDSGNQERGAVFEYGSETNLQAKERKIQLNIGSGIVPSTAYRRVFNHQTNMTLQQKAESLFNALRSLDTSKLVSVLQRLDVQEALTVVYMVDREGHTLIHKAAYENSFGICEYLISFFRDRLYENLIT